MLLIFTALLWYLSSSYRNAWKIQAQTSLEPWPLDQSLIWSHTCTIYELIIDPHEERLQVGHIAQLVEHCTGITDVRVRVLFAPELFSPFFFYCLSSIAKWGRSLTLKMVPSTVQMKFNVFDRKSVKIVKEIFTLNDQHS